jgi:hypothetical protein
VVEECHCILGGYIEADGTRIRIASSMPSAPITDQPIVVSKGGLAAERKKRIGDERSMNREHRVPDTHHLVLEPPGRLHRAFLLHSGVFTVPPPNGPAFSGQQQR